MYRAFKKTAPARTTKPGPKSEFSPGVSRRQGSTFQCVVANETRLKISNCFK
jgi:hypothetical protein